MGGGTPDTFCARRYQGLLAVVEPRALAAP